MKNKSLITVLMTVYNGGRFIEKAIKSVLNQTYTNFKFLIIDNKSIDNTKIIIKSFQDNRIKLIELENNIGQTAALNKGLGLINTKYVARIDADDICLPERIEKQINYLDKNVNVDVLGTWAVQINEDDEVVTHIRPPIKSQEIIDYFSIKYQIGILFLLSGVLDLVRVLSLTCLK